MGFLVLSVLCSVLVSVLLKLAQRRGLDVSQIISWNYVAAVGLCLWLLQPQPATSSHALPWPALLLLAVLLPSIFMLMAASVRVAGIVRTDIAQRLSLVVSLLAAFLWFGESADGWKLSGLLLGVLAMLAILTRTQAGHRLQPGQAWLPLAVLLGYAAVDILLKHIAVSGTSLAVSLLVAFCGALLMMGSLLLWRMLRHRMYLSWQASLAGLLVGASNFGNILFYVKAHRALPDQPAVVFASMNLGVVVLGTLVGAGLFGERLGRVNKLGIALAIIAIGLIAYSLMIV